MSFVFNVGLDEDADTKPEGLGDSTLLRKLNAGDYVGAQSEFCKWAYADGRKMKGLQNRRLAESTLFMKPMEKSRTLAASSVASDAIIGNAGLDMLQEVAGDTANQLEPLIGYSDIIKYAFLVLSLISFGVVAYARIDDWCKAVR